MTWRGELNLACLRVKVLRCGKGVAANEGSWWVSAKKRIPSSRVRGSHWVEVHKHAEAEKSTVRQKLTTLEFENLNRAALPSTKGQRTSVRAASSSPERCSPYTFSLLFTQTVESMQSPKRCKGINKVLIHSGILSFSHSQQ